MKNYIGFVNDHSGSMAGQKAQAAMVDYNAQIKAVKDAASTEMLDTVVSVVGIGLNPDLNKSADYRFGDETTSGVRRQVVISNPHVLKPVTSWPTPGGTPLYDGIGNMIELFQSLPDYTSKDVSFLVMITTDGEEMHSKTYGKSSLADKIRQVSADGRWTFVFRVPRGSSYQVKGLNVPDGNITEWDTTAQGMAASTVATQTATTSYFAARSAGAKSSTSFYTNAAAVNTAVLTDITSEVSLYQVPAHGGRLEIKDFILSKRSKFLKGAAFVQLVKTEPKIGPKKIVLIRERNAPNRIFAGKEAREMLGLPTDPTSNSRIHPGDHGNYDIFIQSESLNRLLPDSVGVIYWEKKGVPFTDADIALFAPKAPVAPSAPVLPAVTGRTKPTPSPVPKAVPIVSGNTVYGRPVKWFTKRDDARKAGSVQDRLGVAPIISAGPAGERWFVYV